MLPVAPPPIRHAPATLPVASLQPATQLGRRGKDGQCPGLAQARAAGPRGARLGKPLYAAGPALGWPFTRALARW